MKNQERKIRWGKKRRDTGLKGRSIELKEFEQTAFSFFLASLLYKQEKVKKWQQEFYYL
ncbi:MAG: hypothetical protein WBP41_04540 [Saprospiraceae bacterium]